MLSKAKDADAHGLYLADQLPTIGRRTPDTVRRPVPLSGRVTIEVTGYRTENEQTITGWSHSWSQRWSPLLPLSVRLVMGGQLNRRGTAGASLDPRPMAKTPGARS